jgi:hypothetical protein
MDAEHLVASLAPVARDWIVAQRDRFRPLSQALPSALIAQFAPFYRGVTLRVAQCVVVNALENPPFYGELQRAAPGLPLIDFRAMDAITFDDTIIVRSTITHITSLFFHELVHVVQYARLRPSEFSARYVRGWALNGMEYANIPLERDAYELQARFESGEAPFSVEDAVVAKLSARNAT